MPVSYLTKGPNSIKRSSVLMGMAISLLLLIVEVAFVVSSSNYDLVCLGFCCCCGS